jgi:hypothetical protein
MLEAVLTTVNVLLLIAGWVLFQQAKSDLTAKAAEASLQDEVRELRTGIARLLEQLKMESSHAAAQMDARLVEAKDLLARLDHVLDAGRGHGDVRAVVEGGLRADRYAEVTSMARRGADPSEISQKTGVPLGEVELVLGLRTKT